MSAIEKIAGVVAALGKRGGRRMLDLLYPPLCVACNTQVNEPHSLCADCWGKISFLGGACCAACGLPFEIDAGDETLCGACHARSRDFDRARALLHYDEGSKRLVLAFKYSDRLDHGPAFVRWMERTGRSLLAESDLVVPVPLHRWRLWRRRYNQAAVLAKGLARLSGKPFAPLLLERTRPTPSQGAMPSAKARRRNVLGAFRVPPAKRGLLKERNVLLVDDVFTTGATLDACARALKRAGAARVDALTLARVVRAGAGTI
ncbi:MAG: ComF family protein [Proteobacteria bacterium]|nr:ComF family protein [Pseudomonadota bacterium]